LGVHRRFLAVLAVAAFVLTLLFAVAAGAQEESTSTEATGEQTVEVQQQQVQNNQQQQVGVQVGAVPTSPRGPLAGANVQIHKDTEKKNFIENGDILRVRGNYEVEDGASITIEDGNNTSGNEDNPQGTYRDGKNANITKTDVGLEIEVRGAPIGKVALDTNEDLTTKGVEVVASDGVRVANSNGGGGGGGSGGGNGTVGTSQTENTTGTNTTNTSNLNTANPDTTTANANLNADVNRPNSGSFRCDLFLRTVSDDQGALRDQYRGNEQIVQRFEQCLSENVLADTIPNRNLPFTGGMSMLFLAAIGLAAVVAGAAVLRAVMRRAG
jgi:hypothetical protein